MNKLFINSLILVLAIGSLVATTLLTSDDAAQYQGRVVKVADGDTITILVDKRQIKIRLGEIDTPERGQPYWRTSKKALENLVAGKVILAEEIDIDRYGRIVAHVYINDIWVNEDLVTNGHAHVYPRYAKSQSLYDAQDFAQKNKVGIWSLPENERMPPWEWRKKK